MCLGTTDTSVTNRRPETSNPQRRIGTSLIPNATNRIHSGHVLEFSHGLKRWRGLELRYGLEFTHVLRRRRELAARSGLNFGHGLERMLGVVFRHGLKTHP